MPEITGGDIRKFETLSQDVCLIQLDGKKPTEKDWTRWCKEKRAFDAKGFEGRNAGIPCGPGNEIIAVDVDNASEFKQLCKKEGWDVPKTRTHLTGSGKKHYLYAYPKNGKSYGCRAIKDHNGESVFDIKGIGGQVVAPGSIHPDTGKPYNVLMNRAIVPAPDWLLALAENDAENAQEGTKPSETPPNKLVDVDVDGLRISEKARGLIYKGKPKGQRSEAIMRVLNALKGALVSEKVIFSIFEAYPIGEKYREKGQSKWRWLKPQIDKAKGYVRSDELEQLKPQIQCQDRLKKRADLIVNQASSPCGPFDTSCLPDSLASYINSICMTTEADPIIVTTAVLCMISSFMKRSHFIPEFDSSQTNPVYFQTLYPNLWCLNISRSGTFKSTALNKGFKIAYDKDEETDLAMKAALPQQIQALKETFTLLPTRITVEALIEHLSEGYGGALVCSEFGTWLESLEKNYNLGLKPLFTELYDVPRIYTYKSKGSGELKVKEPFISIWGASTAEWVRRNVGPEDVSSGFFARFLIFYPPQNDSIPPALPKGKGPIDPTVEKGIKDILEQLPGTMSYDFTRESKEAFCDFHESLYSSFKEDLSERGREMLEPYIKRWSPYALKIGILLQPFLDSTSSTIGLAALEGAIKIVEYAMQSTNWLFQNELGESDHQRKCRKVLEYIAKRAGEVDRKRLISSKVLKGGVTEYDQILESLDQSGQIEIQGDKKRSQKISLAADSVE